MNSPERKSTRTVPTSKNQTVVDSNKIKITNGNQNDTKNVGITHLINHVPSLNENNNKSPEIRTRNLMNIYDVDTSDLILLDNVTNNIIKLEDFKKVDVFSLIDNNFRTSTNSLNSENLSSPMQTSTDVYLDSEILSTTDAASNDSQSPKNLQTDTSKKLTFSKEDIQEFNKLLEPDDYESNDSLSNPKSDKSLLNSEDDSDDSSSPLRKATRDYKKQRKHKKKHFGVKTLQSIFSRGDGYSDISTTASEMGEDLISPQDVTPQRQVVTKLETATHITPTSQYTEPSAQFEQNIHNLLSDIFLKNFPLNSEQMSVSRAVGTKKYFSLHGQNLRVGKALRLCPNEDLSNSLDNEQRKEKLLARYVYKANSVNADGVGDPDFGTPV